MRLARPLINDEPSTYFCDELKPKNMRNFATLMALAAISFQGLAQKEVVSAYNANKEGDYATAASYIEQAIENPKANVKNKTWRYRGEIYLNISKDSTLFAAFPDALTIAKDSYMKAKELDTKGSYAQECQIGLGQVQMAASNAGITQYNTGDFGRAGGFFDLSAEIASAFEATDTMALYNSALCYEKAWSNLNADLKSDGLLRQSLFKERINDYTGDFALLDSLSLQDSVNFILREDIERAVARYNSCADINYQVPNVFLFISAIYRNAEESNKALEILGEARKQFPREQSLIIEELNIYLVNEAFDEAKENLAIAAEQDPTNEILWFSLGSVLDRLDLVDEAIEAYLKALGVKPDYFDANYNLGALYFNQAVQGINKANDLWKPRMSSSEAAKQKKLENDAKALFSLAKPYLEIAHESNGEDVETMRSLKDVYARTGDDDKFLAMNAKLKALGQ